jgi:hypothetical protein
MCNSTIDKYGISPVSIQWRVVRGDTATLRVDFLELDEITGFDTDNWEYSATTYDSSGDILDDLPVTSDGSSITILAPASVSAYWGIGYKSVVAELPFDLQVTLDDGSVWTPIVGTVCVVGDVTPGGSL